jgi:hypothetical protein
MTRAHRKTSDTERGGEEQREQRVRALPTIKRSSSQHDPAHQSVCSCVCVRACVLVCVCVCAYVRVCANGDACKQFHVYFLTSVSELCSLAHALSLCLSLSQSSQTSNGYAQQSIGGGGSHSSKQYNSANATGLPDLTRSISVCAHPLTYRHTYTPAHIRTYAHTHTHTHTHTNACMASTRTNRVHEACAG